MLPAMMLRRTPVVFSTSVRAAAVIAQGLSASRTRVVGAGLSAQERTMFLLPQMSPPWFWTMLDRWLVQGATVFRLRRRRLFRSSTESLLPYSTRKLTERPGMGLRMILQLYWLHFLQLMRPKGLLILDQARF